MRKLVLLLLTLTPALAFAQEGALGGSPFDSAASNLTAAMGNVMGWLIPFTLVLAIVGFGLKTIYGGSAGFNMFPALLAMTASVGSASMFLFMATGEGIDLDMPGKVAAFFSWLLAYGWIILGVVGVGSFLAYMVYRKHANESLEAQLKADVRDLLQVIQLADLVEAYWKPRSEQITAKTRVAKAEKARNELLPMLEQAYTGQALTARQRAKMLEQGAEIAKVAVDEAGAPLDPEAEHRAPPSGPRAEVVSPARPAATPSRPARQAQTHSTPASSTHSCSSSNWIMPAIAVAVAVDALCNDDQPTGGADNSERVMDCSSDNGAGSAGGWGDNSGSDGGSSGGGSIDD